MDVDVPADPYAPPKAELQLQIHKPRRSLMLRVIRAIAIIGNVLLALMLVFFLSTPRSMRVADYILAAIIVVLISICLTAISLRNRLMAWVAVTINGVVALLLVIAYLGNDTPSRAFLIGNALIGGLVALNLLSVALDVLIRKKST